MNAAILTNEFPPEIYGGAGIHVKFLTQELSKLCHIEARCFGSQDVDEDNVRAIGLNEHHTYILSPAFQTHMQPRHQPTI